MKKYHIMYRREGNKRWLYDYSIDQEGTSLAVARKNLQWYSLGEGYEYKIVEAKRRIS